MRKKRGAALPGAILLSSMVVLVSMGLALVLLETASYNNITVIENSKYNYFSENFNKFKVDSTLPENNENFTWKIYEKDADVKALVARSKQGNVITFCGVYDFNQDLVLAYQIDNVYIKVEGGTSYLAGIVPMVN